MLQPAFNQPSLITEGWDCQTTPLPQLGPVPPSSLGACCRSGCRLAAKKSKVSPEKKNTTAKIITWINVHIWLIWYIYIYIILIFDKNNWSLIISHPTEDLTNPVREQKTAEADALAECFLISLIQLSSVKSPVIWLSLGLHVKNPASRNGRSIWSLKKSLQWRKLASPSEKTGLAASSTMKSSIPI